MTAAPPGAVRVVAAYGLDEELAREHQRGLERAAGVDAILEHLLVLDVAAQIEIESKS